MTVLSTSYFGPVVAGVYNFDATWTADPVSGRQGAAFTGRLPKAQAEQLTELVNNPDAAPTIGGVKGVLVPFWSEAPKATAFVGWYLLTGEEHQPDLMGDGFRTVPFTLKGVYLGQNPEALVARSAVPMGDDFDLTAKSIVVSPFRPSSDSGDEFVVTPGGTFATRVYDPSYPHDTSNLTPDSSASIGFYTGTVTDSTDTLRTVAFPSVSFGSTAPLWLTQQGGNCRGYDRRAEREVYGPHPFLETTDLLITNGLVRAWVGNEGLPPFLNVEVFSEGSWQEAGYLHLADPTGDAAVLRGARLQSVTSDSVTVVLTVQNVGDELVTLRRGERMFRCRSPYIRWAGLPPWSSLRIAAQGDGLFGKGIQGDASGFRLKLPALL